MKLVIFIVHYLVCNVTFHTLFFNVLSSYAYEFETGKSMIGWAWQYGFRMNMTTTH